MKRCFHSQHKPICYHWSKGKKTFSRLYKLQIPSLFYGLASSFKVGFDMAYKLVYKFQKKKKNREVRSWNEVERKCTPAYLMALNKFNSELLAGKGKKRKMTNN